MCVKCKQPSVGLQMNAQKLWIKRSLVLGAALLACAAQALTLYRDGGYLYVTGTIQAGDDLLLKASHQEAPVRRLVLVNSPGGALLTSLRIAAWAEDLRLTTVAAGHCLSACSLVFMAGERRQFAQAQAGQMHLIGIHGPYSQRTGQFNPPGAGLMWSYYRSRMGEKFDAAVMEQAIYRMQDPSGLLVVPGGGSEAGGPRPWYCPSIRAQRGPCTGLPDKDALGLGLLTTAEPGLVRIPQEFGRGAEPVSFGSPPQESSAVAAHAVAPRWD
jgi:hypothetical protein